MVLWTCGTRQILGASRSNIYIHDSHICPFVIVRHAKLRTSLRINTVNFSTSQSHSEVVKIKYQKTVRILSFH